jgi:hypothetical protein
MTTEHDAAGTPGAGELEFVPARDRHEPGTRFECGLCGTSFTHGGQVCGACPLNAGCDLVKCPNCGYQFPRSSRIAEWGRRIWRRLAAGAGR